MKVLCFGSLNIDYVYQVDHIVSSRDNEIYLRAPCKVITAPGTVLREDAVNTKSAEYLRNVRHGNALKGVTIPVVLGGSIQRMGPVMSIALFLGGEGVVENRVEIDQLINRTVRAYFLADGVVLTDEVAVDKVFEDVSEVAVILHLQFLCKFFPGIAFLV